ncbi:Hypothetical predicted protein, partial [Pelobates cultripes]
LTQGFRPSTIFERTCVSHTIKNKHLSTFHKHINQGATPDLPPFTKKLEDDLGLSISGGIGKTFSLPYLSPQQAIVFMRATTNDSQGGTTLQRS